MEQKDAESISIRAYEIDFDFLCCHKEILCDAVRVSACSILRFENVFVSNLIISGAVCLAIKAIQRTFFLNISSLFVFSVFLFSHSNFFPFFYYFLILSFRLINFIYEYCLSIFLWNMQIHCKCLIFIRYSSCPSIFVLYSSLSFAICSCFFIIWHLTLTFISTNSSKI